MCARPLTGGGRERSKVWDARTGAELHTLAHKHIVRAVNFLAVLAPLRGCVFA